MKLALRDIQVRQRHRRDLGDVASLAKSIESIGLLHPIVVTPEGRLIAGERRLEAVKLLQWAEAPVTIVRTLDEATRRLVAERDENTCRQDFAPSEGVALEDDLLKLERPKALERQHEGQKAGGRGKKKLRAESAPSLGKVRDLTAKAVGIGRDKLKKARAIVEAAKAEPEKFEKLRDQMDRTGNVHGAFKQLEKRKQADTINAEPPPAADMRYPRLTARAIGPPGATSRGFFVETRAFQADAGLSTLRDVSYNDYTHGMNHRSSTFRLGDELVAAMERLQARDGIPPSEIARRAIEAFLQKKGVLKKPERQPGKR